MWQFVVGDQCLTQNVVTHAAVHGIPFHSPSFTLLNLVGLLPLSGAFMSSIPIRGGHSLRPV